MSSARTSTRVTASSRRSKSPDLLQGEQPGLRRIVQTRLLKDVFDTTSGTHEIMIKKHAAVPATTRAAEGILSLFVRLMAVQFWGFAAIKSF